MAPNLVEVIAVGREESLDVVFRILGGRKVTVAHATVYLDIGLFYRLRFVMGEGGLDGGQRQLVTRKVLGHRLAETRTKDGEELGDGELALAVNFHKNRTVGF